MHLRQRIPAQGPPAPAALLALDRSGLGADEDLTVPQGWTTLGRRHPGASRAISGARRSRRPELPCGCALPTEACGHPPASLQHQFRPERLRIEPRSWMVSLERSRPFGSSAASNPVADGRQAWVPCGPRGRAPEGVRPLRHITPYFGGSSTLSLSPVFEMKMTSSFARLDRLVFSVSTWWAPGCSTQFSP
jgi:hypothetical protein